MSDIPQEAQPVEQTKPLPRLYKHRLGSAQYHFGILEYPDGKVNKSVNGKAALFIVGPGQQWGRYATSNPIEQQLLDNEIALDHPNIFIDPTERELTAEMADPVYFLTQRIRAQVIQEMQEAMAKATNPDRDMGTSEQGKLNAQSTQDVAAVAAGAGPAVNAMLANLKAKALASGN
jgi:hypothetical protein